MARDLLTHETLPDACLYFSFLIEVFNFDLSIGIFLLDVDSEFLRQSRLLLADLLLAKVPQDQTQENLRQERGKDPENRRIEVSITGSWRVYVEHIDGVARV